MCRWWLWRVVWVTDSGVLDKANWQTTGGRIVNRVYPRSARRHVHVGSLGTQGGRGGGFVVAE